MQCPNHQNFELSAVCLKPNCKQNRLACALCIMDHTDHLKVHFTSITSFIKEADNRQYNSKMMTKTQEGQMKKIYQIVQDKINKIKLDLRKMQSFINSTCTQIMTDFSKMIGSYDVSFLQRYKDIQSLKDMERMMKLFDDEVNNLNRIEDKTKEQCGWIKERQLEILNLGNIEQKVGDYLSELQNILKKELNDKQQPPKQNVRLEQKPIEILPIPVQSPSAKRASNQPNNLPSYGPSLVKPGNTEGKSTTQADKHYRPYTNYQSASYPLVSKQHIPSQDSQNQPSVPNRSHLTQYPIPKS